MGHVFAGMQRLEVEIPIKVSVNQCSSFCNLFLHALLTTNMGTLEA